MTILTHRQAGLDIDSAYHQARILLLVNAVSRTPGAGRKLDGLTKLAKLDFLVRYPTLAARVSEGLGNDSRLRPSDDDYRETESPMIRYKYGPWDNRYYPVIGALVGKGLLAYTRGGKGSVALRPTAMGRKIVSELQGAPAWMETAERCEAVAEHVGKLSGNGLKELIYEKLPEILDRPHRELIRP